MFGTIPAVNAPQVGPLTNKTSTGAILQQTHRYPLATALLLALLGLTAPVHSADNFDDPAKKPERIVFLGDSITDGDTYPLLVRQALAEAEKPVPVCINAGIGGDTAAGMLKRLDRDVFARRPTVVTLSAGINDVLHKVPDADYQRDVTAIAERMKKAHVRLIILNLTILGDKHADSDRQLARYNDILHDVAQAYDIPLADVNHLMHDARAAGKELVEEDDVHPNYEGHRLIARAVLDALGDNDVAVPEKMKVELMPGVFRKWKARPVPDNAGPLDETCELEGLSDPRARPGRALVARAGTPARVCRLPGRNARQGQDVPRHDDDPIGKTPRCVPQSRGGTRNHLAQRQARLCSRHRLHRLARRPRTRPRRTPGRRQYDPDRNRADLFPELDRR
jgi:lysophospholipase L1-like esterase